MINYSKFLHEVEGMNEKYASIYINCEHEPLVMPFWSWQTIQNGLSLRQEWEVDTSLIPFYGDWHDLFCLNKMTGEIIALDDNREEYFKWNSIEYFISCLSEKEAEYFDKQKMVSASNFADIADKETACKKTH